MRKKLAQVNRPLFGLIFTIFSIGLFAQGTENFTNYPETSTSYVNGSFTGQDGSTWTYTQCSGTLPISAPAPLLGKGRTPAASVYSGTISGGIGTLVFDYKQAYTTNVNLEVYVNSDLVTTVTSSGEQGSIKSSGTITVNTIGDFVLKFINTSGSAGQVSIDNAIWTGYTGSVDPEPTNHVSSFSATANGPYQIDLSWSDNDGAQPAAGHIVLINKTGTFIDPEDGTAQADDTDLSDGAGVKNVISGTEAYSLTGLDAETQYFFKIYAYTNSASDIDYKIVGTVPTANATTSEAGTEPSTGELIISEVNSTATANATYCELYNNTASTINLDNVDLEHYNNGESSASATLNLSGAVSAGGYVIIARASSDFNTVYGFTPDFTLSGMYLNGGTDGLILRTDSNGAIDSFNDVPNAIISWSDNTLFERKNYPNNGTDLTNHWENKGTNQTGTPNSANDTSLPVELSVWKATSSQGLVKLLWTTDSEIENQGFIIERTLRTSSFDGAQDDVFQWKEIASFATNDDLLGQGSTSAQNEYFFIDKQVKVGKTYSYRLSDVDYRGNVTQHAAISVTVKDAGKDLKPSDMKLHDAFPNPFNPSVNLSFTLEKDAAALSLEIYDIQGALVQTLSSGYQDMGTHDFSWDGHDGLGNAVPSGVYLVRLGAGSLVQIQRVTLLR